MAADISVAPRRISKRNGSNIWRRISGGVSGGAASRSSNEIVAYENAGKSIGSGEREEKTVISSAASIAAALSAARNIWRSIKYQRNNKAYLMCGLRGVTISWRWPTSAMVYHQYRNVGVNINGWRWRRK